MVTPTTNQIYQGDVLQAMKEWPDEFVQTVVTSPPYWGLLDYGIAGQIGLESTISEYLEKMVGVFREVRRVLRSDGTLWLNIGDTYNSGPPGRRNCERWPKQSRNDHQPIRKRDDSLKLKDLCLIPARLAIALQADGWYLRSDIIWAKPNPMPESVTDRPTKAHEYIFLMSKSERYFYDADSIRTPGKDPDDDLRRLGKQHAGNKSVPDEKRQGLRVRSPAGWDTKNGAHGSVHSQGCEQETTYREVRPGANARTVWWVTTQAFPDAHFATFPEKLIEPCILAGARAGEIVLDPFMGAGTTALVAARLNRKFIGIELNPKYIEIAQRRIKTEVAQEKFF